MALPSFVWDDWVGDHWFPVNRAELLLPSLLNTVTVQQASSTTSISHLSIPSSATLVKFLLTVDSYSSCVWLAQVVWNVYQHAPTCLGKLEGAHAGYATYLAFSIGSVLACSIPNVLCARQLLITIRAGKGHRVKCKITKIYIIIICYVLRAYALYSIVGIVPNSIYNKLLHAIFNYKPPTAQ